MTKIIRFGVTLICMLLCSVMVLSCVANGPTDGSPATGGSDGGTQAQADSPDENDGESENDGVDPNAGPTELDMDRDMGISVGGQWFPIWQDASGLVQALGMITHDYVLSTAPSCVFEGEDKEFDFGGIFVFTNPDGARDLWFSIYFTKDLLSTSRGITIGSTLEEVHEAYGDRFYWEGDTILTYSISGIEGDAASPCIQFTIINNRVTAIDIYYPTNVL